MNLSRTQKLTGIAIFTAIVIVLQFLGSFIKFGPFSISLVLIPIVVGASLYGPAAGAWLGFIFGLVVIISGDAAPFLAVTVFGTVVTVMSKGILAGYVSGVIYKLFHERPTLAAILAGLSCPIVNTGVFLINCLIFFMPTLQQWATGLNFNNAYEYMLFGMVGINFLFELLTNVVLSPVIVKVIKMGLNN